MKCFYFESPARGNGDDRCRSGGLWVTCHLLSTLGDLTFFGQTEGFNALFSFLPVKPKELFKASWIFWKMSQRWRQICFSLLRKSSEVFFGQKQLVNNRVYLIFWLLWSSLSWCHILPSVCLWCWNQLQQFYVQMTKTDSCRKQKQVFFDMLFSFYTDFIHLHGIVNIFIIWTFWFFTWIKVLIIQYCNKHTFDIGIKIWLWLKVHYVLWAYNVCMWSYCCSHKVFNLKVKISQTGKMSKQN